MFTIMINPDDYKYLHYACRYYNVELLPPQVEGSYYIFCSIRCAPDVLFRIGRMFERMKIEAENFKDEGEKDDER